MSNIELSKKSSLILVIMLLIFVSSSFSSFAAVDDGINIGDYVEFGSYNGQPILWRVINKDDINGILLFSEKIISVKSMDASGDGTDGRTNQKREDEGSNYWYKSNLREWLNSNEQNVSYSHRPPSVENIFNGYNSYAGEPGFLQNFSLQEQSLINEVTHKAVLSELDMEVKDGGTEVFLHKVSFSGDVLISNYDTSYYEEVNDKVFLLSIKELKEYVADRGYEHRRPIPQITLDRSEGVDNAYPDQWWYYWLRTPYADSGSPRYASNSLVVATSGSILMEDAYNSTVGGIVPALYLKPGTVHLGGDGSLENSYFVVEVQEPPFGDINKDMVVDINDLVELAKAYGAKTGDSSFLEDYDLKADGCIDIFDLVTLAKKIAVQ